MIDFDDHQEQPTGKKVTDPAVAEIRKPKSNEKLGVSGLLTSIEMPSNKNGGRLVLTIKDISENGQLYQPVMTDKFPAQHEIGQKAQTLINKMVQTYVSITTGDYGEKNYFCDIISSENSLEAYNARHKEKPLGLLLRAAKQGDAEAQFKYGVALSENEYGRGKNIVEAAGWFQNAVDQDHMEAKLHLARAYSGAFRTYNEDYGLEIDKKLALHYYKAAAIQGSVDAYYALAEAYDERGFYGQKDLDLAIRYFKKAADLGHINAHYRIYEILNPFKKYGLYYLDPNGYDEKEISKSIKKILGSAEKCNPIYWCEIAAKKDHIAALWVMGSTVVSNIESASKEKRQQAFDWMETLAGKLIPARNEAGEFYEALRIVGNTYLRGRHSYFGDGFEINKEKAFKYLEALAHHLKDVEALYFLGDAYVKGIGVNVDKQKGFEYFKLASECDIDPWEYKTDFEFYDFYVPYNELPGFTDGDSLPPQHYIWLTNISAYFRLGEMFLFGLGVVKDEIQAKKYFNHVVDNGTNKEVFEAQEYLFTIKHGVKKSIFDNNSLDLIGRDEDDYIEYKQTFFRNVNADISICKDTQFRTFKEIASFLNSNDGVLFIGIDDKTKEILGIEKDGLINEDRDKWNNRFHNALREAFGPVAVQNVKTTFEAKDGKTFYRINCTESTQPVWLNWPYKQKKEHFYVRNSDNAIELKGADITNFMGTEKFSKK